ncbi:extracellular solute-binding protein [Hydrogenophilus islandicus]
MLRRTFLAALVSSTLVMPLTAALAAEKRLTVYTSRNEQLIQPVFTAFTEETGIAVRFTTDKDGALIERLKAEGENTPADLLITVDAGNLWLAKEAGVLRPLESAVVTQRIPAHLRDAENHWFGVSLRARPVMRNIHRVAADEITRYEDLADPKWKGRLCLRTSKNVYNQSLVAMMIAELGEEKAEAIVKGWVANLATLPFPNDTAVIKAIAQGVCDVGIANTYYLGRLVEEQPNLPVWPVWTNQNDRGVHVNVSGVGVTRYAKEPELAKRFIEWLTTAEAQKRFAELNHEYPVVEGVAVSPVVASWGTFRQSTTPLEKAGALQRAAVQLMDRAGWR